MKSLTTRQFTYPLIFGLLLGCNAADTDVPSMASTPSCSLTVVDSLAPGEPVIIGLDIHNPGNEAIEVLQYFTPLEGVMGSIYQVSFQGQPLDYLGPMVKRMPPVDEDWLALPAGGSLSAEVEINNSWDLSHAGEYRIELSNDITYRTSLEAETKLLPAGSCGEVQFAISR